MEECNKVKNTQEIIGNRADHMEGRISKLKDRNIEMIQVEEERTKIFFLNEEILWELHDTNRREKITVMGILEG